MWFAAEKCGSFLVPKHSQTLNGKRIPETDLCVKVVTVWRRQASASDKIMSPKIAHVIVINSMAAAVFFFAISKEMSVHGVRVEQHICPGPVPNDAGKRRRSKVVLLKFRTKTLLACSCYATKSRCLSCSNSRGEGAADGEGDGGTFRKFKFRKIYMQIFSSNCVAGKIHERRRCHELDIHECFLVNGSPFVYRSVVRCSLPVCQCDELQSKSHAYTPITDVIKI